jgi:hypothetical protein
MVLDEAEPVSSLSSGGIVGHVFLSTRVVVDVNARRASGYKVPGQRALRGALPGLFAHSLVMDDAPRTPSPGSQLLATLAAARLTRLATRVWWVGASLLAALAYLDAVSRSGVPAPLAGAVFLAGTCVVATVARNATAEAVRPGSVRPGSLARAAGLGAVVHGGLLAAVTVFAQSALTTIVFVLAGAVLVALTRPTTLVAMGVESGDVDEAEVRDRTRRPCAPAELSVPAIVGELRATADEVRATTDPVRKATLAQRRGELLDALAQRDPETLAALMHDSSVRPRVGEGPDGPVPA